LQKYLAHAGVAARRKAEELIRQGKVRVNGRCVRELGTLVASEDRVEVVGFGPVTLAPPRYVVLHKPPRMMTTMRDPEGRRTVASLIPKELGRIVPVGRLDYDTSGVLLLTNDGDLAHLLLHPRFGVEKTYRAEVSGRLEPADVRALLEGVRLEDGEAHPAKMRVVRAGARSSTIDLTVHEGRNRQVRRMFEATGHDVLSLVRLRFGPIGLGDLPPGRQREATPREVRALRAITQAAVSADEGDERD
jgi:23S rRNA pseudouridine2605 synthase